MQVETSTQKKSLNQEAQGEEMEDILSEIVVSQDEDNKL